MRQFLKDNPAVTEEIENKVKAAFGLIDMSEGESDGDSAQDAPAGEAAKPAKASKTAKA